MPRSGDERASEGAAVVAVAGCSGAPAGAGDTNKNDPNDALSVAIAALCSRARREVGAEDYSAVLKVWSKRHHDLSRACNQVTCRLHAVLCGLVPRRLQQGNQRRPCPPRRRAGKVGWCYRPGRHELAGQFLEDLRNLDTQLQETRKKLAAAVKASHTTLTEVFGVGAVIAAKEDSILNQPSVYARA